MDEVEADVFVEGVENDLGYPVEAPGAVNEKEFIEEAKLSDRVVGGTGSLPALDAKDANADMGGLGWR